MPVLFPICLVSSLILPAPAGQVDDASLLVDAQVQAAAAAVAVMEKRELPPGSRARLLLPLASELARLHALRSRVDAAQLDAAESRAAADTHVQLLALRLLRCIELCAATGYSGSAELEIAVRRLALAIEGELDDAEQEQPAGFSEQSGAAPAH